MADATPQKVKRVTKKTKSAVAETTTPVVSSEAQSAEVVDATTASSVAGDAPESKPETTSVPAKGKDVRLTEIPVVDEITALNLMVSFLGLAQKRGAYTIDEASKIWECVKKFQRPV
jgi:hypothetical protein